MRRRAVAWINRAAHTVHARVHREDGVVGGQLVKGGGGVLGVDRSASAHLAGVGSYPRHQLAVPAQHPIQEGAVRLLGDAGQQRAHRFPDVAPDAQVQPRPAAESLAADVDLHDLRPGRHELHVWEVGAQQHQQVALVHRLVAGAVAEQSGHADVVGVVVLDPLLAAQRVPDRGLEPLGQRQDLLVRAGDTTAAEQRDPPRPINQANELVEHLIGWSRVGPLVQPVGVLQVGAAGLMVGHVPGEGDDPHPAAAERLLDPIWVTRGSCSGRETSSQ
jgi:hypothetical protein